MRQRRDKTGRPKASNDGQQADAWSMDDAYRYLTQVVALRDDDAIHELNEKFAQGRLRLHWRRIDSAGAGQEGDVPSASWHSRLLCVSLDRNRNSIDWATGKITSKNDGRAFVEVRVAEDPGRTYELTVSARDVRMLWPADTPSTKPLPNPTRRSDGDFAALTPRVQLTVLALDVLEEQGMVITGMPKLELRERAEQQAKGMAPGTMVSLRTLSDAEAYRRKHSK